MTNQHVRKLRYLPQYTLLLSPSPAVNENTHSHGNICQKIGRKKLLWNIFVFLWLCVHFSKCQFGRWAFPNDFIFKLEIHSLSVPIRLPSLFYACPSCGYNFNGQIAAGELSASSSRSVEMEIAFPLFPCDFLWFRHWKRIKESTFRIYKSSGLVQPQDLFARWAPGYIEMFSLGFRWVLKNRNCHLGICRSLF